MRLQGTSRPARASGGADLASSMQQQLASLNAQRSALNEQLVSLTVRRDLLTQQLRNADDAGKAQLQRQIEDVGNRTARLNADMNRIDDAVNRLLAQADAATPAAGPIPPIPAIPAIPAIQGFRPITVQRVSNLGERVAAAMAGEALVFGLIIFVMWRRLRRRDTAPVRLASEDTGRLEQLQRSVDVMAVEVERIAESQRFVAKLLSERQALGAGPAREVAQPAPAAEEVRAKRS